MGAADDVFVRVEVAAETCLSDLNDEISYHADDPILPDPNCVYQRAIAGLEIDAGKHCGSEVIGWLPWAPTQEEIAACTKMAMVYRLGLIKPAIAENSTAWVYQKVLATAISELA